MIVYHSKEELLMFDKERDTAEKLGISVTELRNRREVKSNRDKLIKEVQFLKEQGYSNVEISKMIGIKESSVRKILK
jgi:DNA-binding Lrp family transcriptional regulator